MDLAIKNARVIDPKNGVDKITNIYIYDGKIANITDEEMITDEVIDGTNLIATPGLIDLHSHLRDPGLTYKEDIESGTMAAAAGGITSIFAMANTIPVTDNEETIKQINKKAKEVGSANVYVVGAMTRGLHGEQLCDYEMMKENGVLAVSDDGKSVENPKVMRDVVKSAKEYGLVPFCHCDDVALIDGGVMNEGEVSRKLGLKGNPTIAEDVVVARDILIGEMEDAHLHISHVSSGTSVDIIRNAKKRGAKVTAETAPHYIALTDEWVELVGANARMNPPLRGKKDRQEIIDGIIDGTIDCIATDHAPHSEEDKEGELAKTMNGIVGFETSFGVSYTYLVKRGLISLNRLIELMSVKPAEIMGLDKGNLSIGADADIALFDIENEYTVSKECFKSKGKNTPFDGFMLYGKAKYTILNGKVVYKEEEKCQ